VLLRHPDGCNLEQFEASRHRGKAEWKFLFVRMNDAWTVECQDGICHRPDGCKGTELTILNFTQSLLEAQKCSVDSE
jgi:hypothetical protein